MAHDGERVDAQVELVGREAPPAGGAVVRPEPGQVRHAKVADAALHLPVAERRPLVLVKKQPPGPAEATCVLSVANQVLNRRLSLKGRSRSALGVRSTNTNNFPFDSSKARSDTVQ